MVSILEYETNTVKVVINSLVYVSNNRVDSTGNSLSDTILCMYAILTKFPMIITIVEMVIRSIGNTKCMTQSSVPL